jgi:hypothetical protein
MNIVCKEIKSDGSEFLIYLMDENGSPLKANIASKENKNWLINDLLVEYFIPNDWVNTDKDLTSKVKEITYEEYINEEL